jgi:uncharacterized protein
MNDTFRTNRGEITLLGILLAVGLVLGGWALGAQIKAVRLADRYVSVRGLAERTVKSDLATWVLDYKEAGDDLPSLYSKTESDRKIILEFLNQQGIESSEIWPGTVSVVDNQANQTTDDHRPAHRYVVEQQVIVQTPRVDQVAQASQKIVTVLRQGVVLNSAEGIVYKFNGLNSIKPDMITEATRNARAAAERFALDAGSSVGTIRQANQGVFSILPINSGSVSEDDEGSGYNNNADSSMMKTVRVVTSVEYYLGK